jgi:MerR family redox-sensitive transcriptional activator SoxR
MAPHRATSTSPQVKDVVDRPRLDRVEHDLSIGAVSDRTGVAPSALRFYEAEGLVHSERSDGNQRRYHREVIRRVSFIRVAQQVGLSLEEIREALSSLPDNRTPTAKDWERLSAAWRPRLDAQIGVLERLRDRLDACIGCGCLSLGVCKLMNPGDVAAAAGPGPRFVLDPD